MERSGRSLERTLGSAELRAALDAATEAVCVADLGGTVLFTNARFEELSDELSLPPRGLVWARLRALVEQSSDAPLARRLLAPLQSDPERRLLAELELAGSRRRFELRSAPARLRSGTVIARTFSLREVTDERAEERIDEGFISLVSHELRTPLSLIKGYLELVLAGEAGSVTDQQRHYLSIVGRSCDRLLELVGGLLLVAQWEAGRTELELEDVDFAGIVEAAARAAATEAAARNVAVDTDLAVLPPITADRARLGEAVGSLISAAVASTPAGGRVGVSLSAAAAAARLDVVGGSAEPVAQGLPIAIAKAVVEAHGGSLSSGGSDENASLFRVELPFSQRAAATVHAA